MGQMNSLIFILSTGRTGTQFFEDYINQTTENAVCRHEPKPSRRFKFLSNLYLNDKVSDKTIINIYTFSRKNLFKNISGKTYIESSNFLFGCVSALNNYYNHIKIIHIVRNPVDYVISHLNHGFWRGYKKFFAKYIPYWLEKLETDDSKVSKPISTLSTRWNYVNKQIANYSKTNDYLFIKFEDLFSQDKHIASETLNKVRHFIDLPLLPELKNNLWLGKPKNFSKKSYQLTTLEKEYIKEYNKQLMSEYGYE
jgi:hypothetical protein